MGTTKNHHRRPATLFRGGSAPWPRKPPTLKLDQMVDHSRLQHTEKPTNKLAHLDLFIFSTKHGHSGRRVEREARAYFLSGPKRLHAAAAAVFPPAGPPPFLGGPLGGVANANLLIWYYYY